MEQSMLYFKTGLIISEKTKSQKLRSKVLDQISADMAKKLPELKGFSSGNLKKRLFAEVYDYYLNRFGTDEPNEE